MARQRALYSVMVHVSAAVGHGFIEIFDLGCRLYLFGTSDAVPERHAVGGLRG